MASIKTPDTVFSSPFSESFSSPTVRFLIVGHWQRLCHMPFMSYQGRRSQEPARCATAASLPSSSALARPHWHILREVSGPGPWRHPPRRCSHTTSSHPSSTLSTVRPDSFTSFRQLFPSGRTSKMTVTIMDQAVGLLMPTNCRLCHSFFWGGPCETAVC